VRHGSSIKIERGLVRRYEFKLCIEKFECGAKYKKGWMDGYPKHIPNANIGFGNLPLPFSTYLISLDKIPSSKGACKRNVIKSYITGKLCWD
jgi:hypothetical protein